MQRALSHVTQYSFSAPTMLKGILEIDMEVCSCFAQPEARHKLLTFVNSIGTGYDGPGEHLLGAIALLPPLFEACDRIYHGYQISQAFRHDFVNIQHSLEAQQARLQRIAKRLKRPCTIGPRK